MRGVGESNKLAGHRAAAPTAVAMGAKTLLILSNVPGVLADFPHESSLIREIREEEIERIVQTAAQGRMRIKLLAAQEALAGGVSHVLLGDARCTAPISRALTGEGTLISKKAHGS